MLWTITYNRQGALQGLAGGQAPERFVTDPKTGMNISTGRHNSAVLPGTFKIYRPARRLRNGEAMCAGSQAEVDALVKKLQLTDEEGNEITTAPLRGGNAPFWKTDAAFLRIEGGTETLDDEDPKGALMLMFMKADPRISIFGADENPAMAGVAQFTLKKFGEEEKVENEKIDREIEAVTLLTSLSFERQTQILSAFGVLVKNPDPGTVRSHLYKRITTDKDKPAHGIRPRAGQRVETNLEMFFRLAKESSHNMTVRDAFTKAYKETKVITKNKQQQYVYGEFILGTSIEAAIKTLQQEEAAEILAELIRDVNT